MKSFGITLAEGSDISNLTVDSGDVFPAEANIGELFYLTGKGLHLFNGDKWILDVLNDDKRLHTANNIVVQLDPGEGQFKSVKEAIASITDASSANRYVIQVQGGNFVEDNPVVMKRFVSIVGWNAVNTLITAKNPDKDLIVGMNDATLEHVALIGASGEGRSAIRFHNASQNDSTRSFIVNDVRFGSNYHNVYVSSSGNHTNLYLFNGQFGGSLPYNEGLRVESTNGGIARLLVRDSTTRGAVVPSAARFGYASGLGAEMLVVASVFKTSITEPAGVGMHVRDGAILRMVGCTLRGFATGLWVENAGVAPTISLYNLGLESNTIDMNIEHPGTKGTFQGTAASSKVISNSTNVSTLYLDPVVQGTNIVGKLNLGPSQSLLTDVTDLIIETPPLGLVSGGVVTVSSGLTLLVGAGAGYLRKDGNVTRVEWPDTPVTLSPNTSPYIYINKNGVLGQAGSLPDELTNLVLARAQAGAVSITALGSMAVHTKSHGNAIEQYLRNAVGPVYVSGSIVTPNATIPRAINVSAGLAYYGTIMRRPSEKIAPYMVDIYRVNGVASTSTVIQKIPNDTIDNGTNLVPLQAGYYTKHGLYSSSEGTFQAYFLSHGQAAYATLEEARAAPLPIPRQTPDAVPIIASIIMKQGVDAIIEINDLRPMFMRPTQGSKTSVTDHGDLTGLGDDDHQQYLLADGTRALVGDLDLNGNDITNVEFINNLRIGSHGTRHAPQGADPIPTGPAVSLSSTTTNTEGITNKLARADHTHSLSGVQAVSSDLTSISAITGTGLLARTATSAWTTRSILGSSGRITMTNGDAINGNPVIDLSSIGTAGTYAQITTDGYGRVISGSTTLPWLSISGKPTTLSGYGITDAQPLDGDLTAIANITTPGFYVNTGVNAAAARTIVGTAGRINVTNGNGVSGNPTIDLPPLGVAGTFTTVTTDGFGRVVSGANPIIVDPGTYTRVTVNDKGLVTSGVSSENSIGQMRYGTIASRTGTSTITLTSTSIPTTSQGTLIVSQTFTPTSVASQFKVEFSGIIDTSFTGGVFLSFFRGTTFIGMVISATQAAAGMSTVSMPITFSTMLIDAPNTTSPVTYTIRIGGNASGTWYLGRTEGHTIGNQNKSYWSITEII